MATTTPNLIVNAVVKTDTRSLKKTSKQISAFDKQINKLSKRFLGLFAASKLAAFAKSSVQAFAADEKAAKSLAIQLKNTGNAFAAPGVEAYIKYLERATGVLDDELRPAFQNILTVTGDVTKSQNGLNTALNVAAGTGKSVEEISMAIAKAYSGQTTAIQRLGVGIDAATLKSGDMVKILGELDTKFKGQALERSGYTRQVDDLNVALANVKETIGKGLLDAFAQAGGPNGMKGFTDGLLGVADALGKVFNATGKVIGALGTIGNVPVNIFKGMTPAQALGINTNRPTGTALPRGDRAYEAAQMAKKPLGDRAIDAKIFAQKKSELDLLNKKNVATAQALKDEAALAELKKKFDVERAGLEAALIAATDEETKARIRAQLQILDDSKAGASATLAKVNSELSAAKAAETLRTAMDNAASATKLASESRTAVQAINYGNYLGIPATNALAAPLSATTVSPGAVGAGSESMGIGGGGVTINLQSLDPSNALQVIQDGIQQLNRYGMNLAYAGSLGIVG